MTRELAKTAPSELALGLSGAKPNYSWYLKWTLRNRDLSSSQKHLMGLGYSAIVCWMLLFITPSTLLSVLRPAYMVTSALFLIVCGARKQISIRIAAPFVIALVLQLWSFFCGTYASIYLGRPLTIARAETYILESTIPFFVSCALIEIDRNARKTISNLVLVMAGLSAFFGYLQFCRIPPILEFAKLYTYKPIDFWDGQPGLRAVGLTFHPSALALQAGLGFLILASRSLHRRLTRWEAGGMLFFSGAVLISQDRTILAAVLASWLVLLFWLFRSDRKLATQIIGAALACILIAGVFAARRFGYLTQSGQSKTAQLPALDPQHFSFRAPTGVENPGWLKEYEWSDSGISQVRSSDASLDFRLNLWKVQLRPIWPKLWLTGIGPSSGLLNGTGPEDKYVPLGHVMENGYYLMVAMYGIPGLLIFITGLAVAAISSLKVAFDRLVPSDRSEAAVVACAGACFLAAACSTANTVDNYMKVPLAWLLGGLAMKSALDATWGKKERFKTRPKQ